MFWSNVTGPFSQNVPQMQFVIECSESPYTSGTQVSAQFTRTGCSGNPRHLGESLCVLVISVLRSATLCMFLN